VLERSVKPLAAHEVVKVTMAVDGGNGEKELGRFRAAGIESPRVVSQAAR
jgi:hypothetical protein